MQPTDRSRTVLPGLGKPTESDLSDHRLLTISIRRLPLPITRAQVGSGRPLTDLDHDIRHDYHQSRNKRGFTGSIRQPLPCLAIEPASNSRPYQQTIRRSNQPSNLVRNGTQKTNKQEDELRKSIFSSTFKDLRDVRQNETSTITDIYSLRQRLLGNRQRRCLPWIGYIAALKVAYNDSQRIRGRPSLPDGVSPPGNSKNW